LGDAPVSSRRLLARVRSKCPLLPVVVGLVLGQLFAWWGMLIAGLALVVLLGASWKLHRFSLTAPFVLGAVAGWLSMGLLISGISEPYPEGEKRFVAEILRPPRHSVPGAIQFEVRVRRELEEDGILRGKTLRCRAVDLPWREVDGAQRGDVFVILARVRPLVWETNPFSYSATMLRHGVSGECRVRYAARLWHGQLDVFERARRGIKEHVTRLLGNHERAGLLLALTLGERDGLSLRTEKAFRSAGLSHLLVLSGFQVSLVYAVLFWGVRGLGRMLMLRGSWFVHLPALLSFLGTSAFVALVGVDSSSLRAALAMLLVVSAKLSERSTSLWGSIVGSLCVLTTVWPGAIFEPGVQLTYGALIGIGLGAEGSSSKLGTFIRVSFWATLVPLALSAVWFGSLSAGGLILNPLLAPLLSTVGTLAGGGAMVLSLTGIDRGGAAMDLVASGLTFLKEWVVACSRIPGVFFEVSPEVGTAILATVLALALLKARNVLGFRLKLLNFIPHLNRGAMGSKYEQAF